VAEDAEDTIEKVSEQSEAASKLLGEKRFFVMPIPISNPTIGTGLGVSAMQLFRAGMNGPPSRGPARPSARSRPRHL
jgi:hypothetical protein